VWGFGDGVTSTLESPTHTYTAGGVYTVTLTVTGPGKSSVRTNPGYITVQGKFIVYLPLVVRNR
jgi:PKD repeat protein